MTGMMRSGETIDLSKINGVKADKHSTGGVGDKTSLVLCPMVAACGVKIAKMSGRGLGHTGGTIDKLESFPGYSTSISEETFINNVNTIGIAITGQTAEIDPADKKLYALRDVTGTVPSIPLIVSSIMSKKLAAGADIIVLDVKSGSGSFMKTEEQSRELAAELVSVGRMAGKKTVAVITDMDEPLGYAVGNALEVEEAIRVLRGEEQGDVLELCLTLGACILTEAGFAADDASARKMLEARIADGSALEKLAQLVEGQCGDRRAVYDTSLLPQSPVRLEAVSAQSGFVSHIQADSVGLVSMHLGGGRVTKESVIDLSVGLELHKKVGDEVHGGYDGADDRAVFFLQRGEHRVKVAVLFIQLGDVEHCGLFGRLEIFPAALGADGKTVLGGAQDEAGFNSADGAKHLAHKVLITGAVQHVDLAAAKFDGSQSGGYSDLALYLLGVVIADGVAVGDLAETVEGADREQHENIVKRKIFGFAYSFFGLVFT